MRVVFLLAALIPTLALAQVPEDAMEMQRCIWRCQADHGAGNAGYNACIAQFCDEGESDPPAPVSSPPVLSPPVSSPPVLPAGPGVLAGMWSYGAHPALGPAAFITTQAGTVGIGCGTGGYALGLRFSNSFAAAGPVTLMTAPSQTAASYPRLQGDWSGQDGDACMIPFEALAAGAALYILPAQIDKVIADGATTRITLSGAAGVAEVTSAEQGFAAFGGFVLPLTGARRALQALAQNCPAARQALDIGCGD